MPRMLEAVTFDFWNTLAWESPPNYLHERRRAAWLGILEEAGAPVPSERLDSALRNARLRHAEEWEAGRQFGVESAATHALEELALELPDETRAELVASFAGVGADAELHLTPGVEECLRALRAAGLRLGIVCDVGFTPGVMLRGFLERQALLELFDGWAFSDEVGVYKPAAEIFEHALRAVGGVEPERAAHVGDLRRTDIAGARALGMTAVRYTGIFDDDTQPEPEGHHVVGEHAELPAALGV
jgi:putative hydrolase of the HAD superfamily